MAERVVLMKAECEAGCCPCYRDCAVTRFMLAAAYREADQLLREQPPLFDQGWSAWQDRLLQVQDHIRSLQLDVERLSPSSRHSVAAAAVRLGRNSRRLH